MLPLYLHVNQKSDDDDDDDDDDDNDDSTLKGSEETFRGDNTDKIVLFAFLLKIDFVCRKESESEKSCLSRSNLLQTTKCIKSP